MKKHGLYLVLDCKDAGAIPKAREVIQDVGNERCLLHGWIDALRFQPYPPETDIEPQWQYEDLPHLKLFEIKKAYDVPLIVSARGLTQGRLKQDGEYIVQRILDMAVGNAEAVNFNLPNGEVPEMDIIQCLLDKKMLTWLNIDCVPPSGCPTLFLGMTDNIKLSTDPKEFA